MRLSSDGPRPRLNSNPPGNQEVGGPDRECGGSSSAQAGSQTLDEWEFVWCLGADGERFLPTRDRDPSETTRQRGFAAEHTATVGLYLVIFSPTPHCSCDSPRLGLYRGNWQCALLDRFAPSDAAHSTH